MEPPYQELRDLLAKILEWWDENGKMRERIGELIKRKGMRTFLRAVGLPAVPQMVKTHGQPVCILLARRDQKGGKVRWERQILALPITKIPSPDNPEKLWEMEIP